MFKMLKKWFRATPKSNLSSASKIRCFRPTVENLEDRMLMSSVPNLAGTWAINGLPTLVQQSGSELTFTNESDNASAGNFTSSAQVVATNWGNLVGTISGNPGAYTISWANGTVWHETASTFPNLGGAWNINGLPTQIQESGIGLTFTNEANSVSAGNFISSTQVVATNWGNLVGTISGTPGNYTISWANGTVWHETASTFPNLAGVWNINGLPTQIQQSGSALTFTNEGSNVSAGNFLSATQVVATGWANLVGTISGTSGNYTISWANGTVWSEGAGTVPNLAGAWNINGLPTQIQESGIGLSFTNEGNNASAGNFTSATQVVATNWGNLVGTISGSPGSYTISWANGTVWSEGAGTVPNLAGAWNINGLPTQIQESGIGLTFTNERNSVSAGNFTYSTQVVATNWGNLVGTISGNPGAYTISWANGTVWQEAAGTVPNLAGAWNIDGLPTQIQESGIGLTFTNERNSVSAGNFTYSTQVVATNWGNLVGTISGNPGAYTISWANGTVWQEAAGTVPNLAGAWNINGLPTQIQQSGPGLTFTNERNSPAGGYFTSATQVVATDWGNLVGTVSGSGGNYTISWANGTVWHEGAGTVPNLAGAWNINGLPTQIQESGIALTFTNERDNVSAGSFVSASQVVATGWANLAGTISGHPGKYSISWANGTVWREGGVSQFLVTFGASGTFVGDSMTVTVMAVDPSNAIVNYTGSVALSSSNVQCVPGTSVSLVHGIGTATVTGEEPGSAKLTATLGAVRSTSLISLTIYAKPSSTVWHLVVAARDDDGYTIPSPYQLPVDVIASTLDQAEQSPSVGYAELALEQELEDNTIDYSAIYVVNTGSTPDFVVQTVNLAGVTANFVVATPSSTTAGATTSVTVTAFDAYGNVVTDYSGTVSFDSSDQQAGLPPTYTFTTADQGSHTFTLNLDTAGSQSIIATDMAAGISDEANVQVMPAAAASLVVSVPASVTASTPISLTVTAYDPYGNVATGYAGTVSFTSNDPQAGLPTSYTFTAADQGSTMTAYDASGNVATGYAGTVSFSSSDPQAGLPASYTFGAADQGSHTFTVDLDTAGSETITATDSADAISAQANVQVMPAATSFMVTSPSSIGAGATASVTVTAYDAYGNVVTGYAGTVSFGSSDQQAGLPASYTFTTADQGSHTFTVNLDTTGSQSIIATDSADAISSQATVQVTPAAVSSLVFSVPANTSSGATASVTVTAYDAYANVATGYVGIVSFTSSDQHAGLPASYTFATADQGSHTFTVNLDTAGSQSIIATDSSNAISSQATVQVTSAAAASLVVGAPATTAAGALASITITAFDAYGNVATGYAGIVSFSSSDQKAGLPANYTFTTADQGSHIFTLNLDTAGSQTVTVIDNANAISAQASILVTPAAATSFEVRMPNTMMAGVPLSATVQAVDAYGNVASGYSGTVMLTSSDAHAVLPVSFHTFSAGDQGSHSFTVTFKTTGSQELSVWDISNFSMTNQAGVQVTAVPTKLLVKSQSTVTVNAEAGFSVVIDAVDSQGHLATGFNGLVTIALANNPGGSTLGGTQTVQAVNGVATFSALTLNKAGSGYTLKVSSGTLTGATATLGVTAAAATQLVLVTQPSSSLIAGAGFSVVVKAEDAYGNVVTKFNGPVTLVLASNLSGGTLGGKVAVTAVNGIATFSGLTLNKAGTGYALNASSGTLAAATTHPLAVAAAAATHLVVTSQPPNGVAVGAGFGLVVTAEDAYGNIATTFKGAVMVALANNPGKTTLGGKLTVAAVNGVASFSGLTLNKIGSGYTLKVIGGTLIGATTGFVNVISLLGVEHPM